MAAMAWFLGAAHLAAIRALICAAELDSALRGRGHRPGVVGTAFVEADLDQHDRRRPFQRVAGRRFGVADVEALRHERDRFVLAARGVGGLDEVLAVALEGTARHPRSRKDCSANSRSG
jgi:hypothetical protein